MSPNDNSDPVPDEGRSAAKLEPSVRRGHQLDEEQLVPMWLAALVLVLLLAVVGLGGYVIRGLVSGQSRAATPQQLDVSTSAERVKKNPNDPQTHLALGYAYEVAGQYSKALAEYDAVLKLDPRNSAAFYNKGVVYLKLGQSKNAEQSWWQVLSVDKTQALAAKALGEYYAGKNQYKSLLVAVEPAADAHPEMADLQYLAGLGNEHIGKRDLAIQRYQLALKYSPDMAEALAGLKRLGVTQP